MKNPLAGAAMLIEVVIAPGAACRRAVLHPRALGPWLVLGVLAVAVQFAGLAILRPVLRADPQMMELGSDSLETARFLRAATLATALASPLLILLRAGLVTLALDGVAGLLGRGRSGRSFWTWVLGIEAVLLLEQAAGVVALALDPPPSLATVRQHALQAGIGLLHEFNHPAAAAFSDAANVFSIWWAVLLGVGLTRVMGFGRIAAGWLAFVTWSCLVGLRMLGGMR